MFTTQGPKDMPEPRELSGAEIDRGSGITGMPRRWPSPPARTESHHRSELCLSQIYRSASRVTRSCIMRRGSAGGEYFPDRAPELTYKNSVVVVRAATRAAPEYPGRRPPALILGAIDHRPHVVVGINHPARLGPLVRREPGRPHHLKLLQICDFELQRRSRLGRQALGDREISRLVKGLLVGERGAHAGDGESQAAPRAGLDGGWRQGLQAVNNLLPDCRSPTLVGSAASLQRAAGVGAE